MDEKIKLAIEVEAEAWAKRVKDEQALEFTGMDPDPAAYDCPEEYWAMADQAREELKDAKIALEMRRLEVAERTGGAALLAAGESKAAREAAEAGAGAALDAKENTDFLVRDRKDRMAANAERGKFAGRGAPIQDKPRDRDAFRVRVARAWEKEKAAAKRAKRAPIGKKALIKKELDRFKRERKAAEKDCGLTCSPDTYYRLFFKGEGKAGGK